METDELVLLYQLDASTEKGLKVRETLSNLNIRVKSITHDMLSQTIGDLADLPGHAATSSVYTGEPVLDEVLLMKDLSDDRIDQVLKGFRENGVSRIALKAVVTPHNQAWTLLDLIVELRQEHAVMERFNQLHQSVRMADHLLASKQASHASDSPLVQVLSPATQKLVAAVRDARALLKTRELPEMDEMDAILGRLETALAQFQS